MMGTRRTSAQAVAAAARRARMSGAPEQAASLLQRGAGRARAGKRELPAPLRNRMTEVWVAEPAAREDLRALVAAYLAGAAPAPPVDAVVDFYLAARAEAVRARAGPPCRGVVRAGLAALSWSPRSLRPCTAWPYPSCGYYYCRPGASVWLPSWRGPLALRAAPTVGDRAGAGDWLVFSVWCTSRGVQRL
jgi:hypothetical protein